MKSFNLAESDSFFHCMANCKVSKDLLASSIYGITFGSLNEGSDYIRGRLGKYGDGRVRSHTEMFEDNMKDLSINLYGISCSSDTSCSNHCGV